MHSDWSSHSYETEYIIEELNKWKDCFDFSNLEGNHEIISKLSKKIIVVFKNGTQKIWKEAYFHELWILKLKFYSFVCSTDKENKVKTKVRLKTTRDEIKNGEKNKYIRLKVEKNVNTYFNEKEDKEKYMWISNKLTLITSGDKRRYTKTMNQYCGGSQMIGNATVSSTNNCIHLWR